MTMYPDMPRKGFFVPAMSTMVNPNQLKYGQTFGMMMGPMPTGVMPNVPAEAAQDKILKDQNFLSSDDKLYEGIIYHGLSLKNVFSECQFSEKLLGSYIFRAIKKNVFDPNTIIFEDSDKTSSTNSNNNNLGIVEKNSIDIIQDNGRVPMMPDTTEIFKKAMENKKKRNGITNTNIQ